jgi:signal transduction histidine kinase
MVIHVRDRGVGFDQEAVGTRGLSLSIVEPVEKVGGDVWLETAPGEGTEVAIRVPVDV